MISDMLEKIKDLETENLFLKNRIEKMRLCGICKNYTQENCECELCSELVNIWETCEKWRFRYD